MVRSTLSSAPAVLAPVVSRAPAVPAVPLRPDPPACAPRLSAPLAILVLAVLAAPAAAQYPPVAPELDADTRVDTDLPGRNASVEPRVVSTPDGALHIVWLDHRSGTWGVWYRRVTDLSVDGSAAEVELSVFANQPANVLNPADPVIATDGDSHLYVAWRAASVASEAILFVRSTDGGLNWSQPSLAPGSNLNFGMVTEYAGPPSICADDAGNVHVAWAQSDTVFDQIYMASSHDSGQSFSQPQLNQPVNAVSAGHSEEPVVACDGLGGVYVAWLDHRDPEKRDVFLRRSVDFGTTLLPGEARLSPHSTATDLHLLAHGDTPGDRLVMVAWLDLLDAAGLPETRVLSRWSTDGGASFSPQPVQVAPDCVVSGFEGLVAGPTPGHRAGTTAGGCQVMHVDLAVGISDSGDVWAAHASLDHPLVGQPSAVHVTRFHRESLIWEEGRRLSRGGVLFPDRGVLPALPQLSVAARDETAFVAWMMHGRTHTQYAEVVLTWTEDGGDSWAPLSLATTKTAGPGTSRSAAPRLVMTPGGAGIVWDDRRNFTDHSVLPLPPGSPLGNPDVYFNLVTLARD